MIRHVSKKCIRTVVAFQNVGTMLMFGMYQFIFYYLCLLNYITILCLLILIYFKLTSIHFVDAFCLIRELLSLKSMKKRLLK